MIFAPPSASAVADSDEISFQVAAQSRLSSVARTKLLGSVGEPALDQQLLELKSTVTRIAELLEKN